MWLGTHKKWVTCLRFSGCTVTSYLEGNEQPTVEKEKLNSQVGWPLTTSMLVSQGVVFSDVGSSKPGLTYILAQSSSSNLEGSKYHIKIKQECKIKCRLKKKNICRKKVFSVTALVVLIVSYVRCDCISMWGFVCLLAVICNLQCHLIVEWVRSQTLWLLGAATWWS